MLDGFSKLQLKNQLWLISALATETGFYILKEHLNNFYNKVDNIPDNLILQMLTDIETLNNKMLCNSSSESELLNFLECFIEEWKSNGFDASEIPSSFLPKHVDNFLFGDLDRGVPDYGPCGHFVGHTYNIFNPLHSNCEESGTLFGGHQDAIEIIDDHCERKKHDKVKP